MKIAIVKFSDIAKCHDHNMSADHWVNGHATETCNPVLKKKVKNYEEKLAKETAEEIAQIRKARDKKLAKYKKRIRI